MDKKNELIDNFIILIIIIIINRNLETDSVKDVGKIKEGCKKGGMLHLCRENLNLRK